jgi:diacylglycerol O-acyltransferase / wax synthase
MQQLSAEDARLINAQTQKANANVSLIHIYDQSTVPGGTLRFKTVLKHIESRLGRSPVFRRKLQRVPMGLDRPYWIDDENFDIEYHVQHIALPKPGDWRQFCIQVSRIHARPLDLDRPLWEIYVVEGLDAFVDLPAGSFALLTKTHHAGVDLDAGSEITELLHDLAADVGAPPPPEPWFPRRAPRKSQLLRKGLVNSVTTPMQLAQPLLSVMGQLVPSAMAWMSAALHPAGMPETRFNAAVSPHRVFESRRFPLQEVKAIRTLVPGATVNDVVLAICSGALRSYLQRHDELPEDSLTTIAPMYLQPPNEASDAAPELAWAHLRLATQVADPRERLRAICAQTAASQIVQRAVPARQMSAVTHHSPAASLAIASKLIGREQSSAGRSTPLASCIITNVPGPEQPMYLCGARLTYFSAILPITDGMGLVFGVTSYDGRIIISPTSCRELMPNPAEFAQDVRDSFQALWALVAQPSSKAVAKAVLKPAPKPKLTSKLTSKLTPKLKPPASKPKRPSASTSGRASRAARSV